MVERKKGMNESPGIRTEAMPERVSIIAGKVQGDIGRPKVREDNSGPKLDIRGSLESSGVELYVGGSDISTEQIRIQAIDVSTAAEWWNEYHQQSE